MVDIEKLLKDFGETKKHITSAVLGAAGWEMRQFDALSSGPQVFLYIFDKPTGFTWMGAIPRDEFIRISLRSARTPNKVNAVRNGLSAVIYDVAPKVVADGDGGDDWELQMATLIAAYAGTTKIWAMNNHMAGGGHFIVVNYRESAASEDSMLRPFAIPGSPNSALPIGRLQESIEQVVLIDHEMHPEWFR